MHRVQEYKSYLYIYTIPGSPWPPSLIAVPLDTRLDDTKGRIRMYAKAKNACTCTRDGRESRNNNGNDNNDHDDNVREQDSPGEGSEGRG